MEFRQSQFGDLDQIVRIAEDAKAGFAACGELLLDRCEEAGDPRVGYERILR